MTLQFQSFAAIVANSAAAVQASTSQRLNLGTGSVIRALLEANASIALWMQWLIVCLLRATRAATSEGEDLDSWMADFGLIRLPPVAGQGLATFSRYSTLSKAIIPVRTLIKTGDGSQSYEVSIAESNPAWDSSQAAYVMDIGSSSVAVPIVAQTAGVAGNVQAGTITMIAAPLPGIDLVSNNAAIVGGIDAETDAAFRARFRLYINSRSRATLLAVENAISSVQQGLSYRVQENTGGTSEVRPGSFLIAIDDGSGTPSAALIGSVASAVDLVRPLGSVFTVRPAAVQWVSVSCALSVAPSATTASVIASVQNGIVNFINALPIGAPLPITRVAQIAYDVADGIQNVSNIRLNSGTNDIVVDPISVIKAGSVVITS